MEQISRVRFSQGTPKAMKENLDKKSGDKDEENKPAKTPQEGEEDNTIYTEYEDAKEKEEEIEEKKKNKK